MEKIKFEQCPYCKSTNIAVGYQLGAGQMFADLYAYQSSADCSSIEHLICKDCNSILHSRVTKTQMFHPYTLARQEELYDYIERNGILLCNANENLPSLCSLGYEMENIIGLIELHKVFYCKAYKKRSTYLSVKAYQLLKRCRSAKELTPEAKDIYQAMNKFEYVDRDEFRQSFSMDKKTFDKAFDLLLENLYITAFAGKRLNSSWYTYLYCSAQRFEKEISGLHYNGDPREALRTLVGRNMSERDFINLIK